MVDDGGRRWLDAAELAAGPWLEETSFRLLSFSFVLRCNHVEVHEELRRVLGAFESAELHPIERRTPATPGLPVRYSVVHVPADPVHQWHLYYGDAPLFSWHDVSAIVAHVLWHTSSEAFRRTGDWLLVHAGSVVAPDGGVVLLPAPSGAGKTTFVAALVRAGFGFLSDEAAVIDPVSRAIHPFPRALALKAGSPALSPELAANAPALGGGKVRHVLPTELRPGCERTGPHRLRLVLVGRHHPGVATDARPLESAQTAQALLANGINLSLYGRRALPALADLATEARGYRGVWGDIDDAVRLVHDLLHSA